MLPQFMVDSVKRCIITRPLLSRVTVLLTIFLVISAGARFYPHFFESLDEVSTHIVWRSSSSKIDERRIVIVDIDERSIQEIGPWPWSRDRITQLVERLDDERVGLKLFDIVFTDAKAGDLDFFKKLASNQAAPNVPAQVFSIDSSIIIRAGQLSGALANSDCPHIATSAHGYLGNAASWGAAGHITPRIDADGAVRHIPALICYEGKTYPNLVLAGLNQISGSASTPVELKRGSSWFDPAWSLIIPNLPGMRIPLNDSGDMRISYRLSRDSFLSVSATDVLNGRIDDQLLDRAWVIIGATAFGLGDAIPTPHGGAVSGVEVHAQLLAAVLDDRLPYAPLFGRAWPWLMTFIAFGFMFIMINTNVLQSNARRSMRSIALPIVGILIAAALFLAHAGGLLLNNWFLGWSLPASLTVTGAIGLAMLEHVRSRWQEQRIFQHLSSYLPGTIAEDLAQHDASDDFEAQRHVVTVLNIDLRNFSAYCEKGSSTDAARVLHDFFVTTTGVVEVYEGVVEHMVGDSILAVWNGLSPCEDHAYKAVRAAIQLSDELAALLQQTDKHGLEPLDVGIGVETGLATIGSFGPQHRRTHTVLGQTVTLAVQLQSMTAELAYPILVGPGTAKALSGRVLMKPLGSFLIHGLTEAHNIFAIPVGLSGGRREQFIHISRQSIG